jgi:hypothetical protein
LECVEHLSTLFWVLEYQLRSQVFV